MRRLFQRIRQFLARSQGTTAVEYAMALLLVFLACLTAITVYGQATARSLAESGAALQQSLGK
jgi:Flp pilus assembly pilin Flp